MEAVADAVMDAAAAAELGGEDVAADEGGEEGGDDEAGGSGEADVGPLGYRPRRREQAS